MVVLQAEQQLSIVLLQVEQQKSIVVLQEGSEGRSAVGGAATVEWGLAAGGSSKSLFR